MANTFLTYISDEHLLNCIENLYNSYKSAKEDITQTKFYSNKVDIFKLIFDLNFNDLDEESLIEFEINRQVDKTINNSIGTFHEEILGGISGYEKGNLSGYDIRSTDNTLFADIKNKHNTMNSSSAESLFQKLAGFADRNKKATCYWVQILAKGSFNELWSGDINGKEYSHSRVKKISGDKFYELLTGEKDALLNLYKVLPSAIKKFLENQGKVESISSSALSEISSTASKDDRNIIDQITKDNYPYYSGSEDL